MKHPGLTHIVIAEALLCLMPLTASCQRPARLSTFTFSKHHFCDTIPIEVTDGQIYLKVWMGGRICRMNLDTGSGQGMVFSDGLPLGARNVGNVVARDANGRQDTVPIMVLPQLTLGSLRIEGYVAQVTKRPSITANYDGTIGFDLFRNGIAAKIDMAQRRLILTDQRDLFRREPGYELKYKLLNWAPYVLVSPFMRHTDTALFDTGSRDLFTMNRRSFETHAYKSRQVNAQVEERVKGQAFIGVFGSGEENEVVFLRMDRLKWENFSFARVRAITSEGASRIGAAILDYGTMTIDPFRRRLKFRPYNGEDSVVVDNPAKATAFVPYRGRPIVGLIRTGSDAYRAGMRQGDRVDAINGRAIRSFNDFVRYPFVDGRTYTFTLITRKGERKEVTVKR